MVQNPPAGCQRIIPYLVYADAPAALAFLCAAFGFESKLEMPGPDGMLMHAEIGYQDNRVMLATAVESMGHASPKDLPARHASVLCYVDDVDAHYEAAKAAGASIIEEPETKFYGDRMYSAADTEGHHWYFSTHVEDVDFENMSPPA